MASPIGVMHQPATGVIGWGSMGEHLGWHEADWQREVRPMPPRRRYAQPAPLTGTYSTIPVARQVASI